MSRDNMNMLYKKKAFDNIVKAVDFGRTLPGHVYVGPWSAFLFFPSDLIFMSDFSQVVNEILCIEQARVACLLNVDKTELFEFDGISAIFLDEIVSGEMYDQKLRDGGPASGWIYRVDRYACASDIGDWCIYCEKSNDVAVIGLRNSDSIKKFEKPLQKLWAKPISDLTDGSNCGIFPFNQLVPDWRSGLLENYGF